MPCAKCDDTSAHLFRVEPAEDFDLGQGPDLCGPCAMALVSAMKRAWLDFLNVEKTGKSNLIIEFDDD